MITIQEENRMLGEDRTDTENKLSAVKAENDQMQQQLLEGSEELDEAKRNLRECEAKLAQVTRERESRSEKLV